MNFHGEFIRFSLIKCSLSFAYVYKSRFLDVAICLSVLPFVDHEFSFQITNISYRLLVFAAPQNKKCDTKCDDGTCVDDESECENCKQNEFRYTSVLYHCIVKKL